MELVTSLDGPLSAIRTLSDSLDSNPELAGRLGQAHAFYAIGEEGRKPLFGFSKFVGYEGLTARGYLERYRTLDDRETERILAEWMAPYGKRPRGGPSQKIRIMVLRPEFRKRGGAGARTTGCWN